MKKLGKIASVKFGTGGYQDALFGLSLSFDFDGTSCSTFEGQWATRSPHARYSEDEWRQGFLDKMLEVKRIMTQAKVDDIGCLRGIPIEAEFDGNALKSWRVLTEVL